MADSGSNKRRRTSPYIFPINDLPHALLGDVASYLPKPTRAFFAMAMTSKSSRLPSAAGSVILSSTRWDILDFGGEKWGQLTLDCGDFEKGVAERMTDGDLFEILSCTNAKTTLNILKLTGCVSITGRGLEPLRGSTVLQQIDSSLVGNNEGPLDQEPSISEAVVLPILHSIIDTHSNSLTKIRLPVKWRKDRSPQLEKFLKKFHYPSQMIVEGCGISEINGVFEQAGTVDDVPQYLRTIQYNGREEDFRLFRCKLTDSTR